MQSKFMLFFRAELQRIVGYSIPDSSLQRVSSLAHRLFALQQNGAEVAVIQAKVTDGLHDNNPEFGFNITFQAPARFLLDVPLENGISVTGDSCTVSSILYEEHDYHLDSATQHLNSDREIVNLRWLKDACDMIVKGDSSPLSGDELAMALCRVLLSNKTGDEVLLIQFSNAAFILILTPEH